MSRLPPEETRFQPGHAKQGGRTKGTRNKLSLSVLTDMLQVWQERADPVQPLSDVPTNGVAALRILLKEDAGAFVRAFTSILPKEIELTESPLAELDDDELTAVIALARAKLGRDPEDRGGGKDETRSLN